MEKISVLLKPGHYDIIYEIAYIEKYPEIENYDKELSESAILRVPITTSQISQKGLLAYNFHLHYAIVLFLAKGIVKKNQKGLTF